MTQRRLTVVLVCCIALIGGFLLWWFYGTGLSEATAYKLADEYVQIYAKRNRIDLNQYTPPTVGAQKGRRLYEFNWTSKQDRTILTITVDPMNVEVLAIKAPGDTQAQ